MEIPEAQSATCKVYHILRTEEMDDKEQRLAWLGKRKSGIGASEASALLGLNPYMSNIDLWEIKTGRKEAADISNVACVQYGFEAEAPLRDLFRLDHPQYEVTYKNHDLVRHKDHPFILATLDGRLREIRTGRLGVLEIKTTEIMRSMQKEKWKDQIPQNYYIQVLQQLLATGWDFAVLKAQLKYDYGDGPRLETKHYYIERDEVKDDIEYLLLKEVEFWNYNVVGDIRPNLILPEI